MSHMHKHTGIEGSFSSPSDLCNPAQQSPHSVVDRQHNGDSLHQSQRRHPFSGPIEHSNQNVGVVFGKKPVNSCRTHPRKGKCQGGQGTQMVSRSKQLVPQQDNLQVARSQMGIIRCGPFCGSSQQAAKELLQFSSRPTSGGDRCIGSSGVKSKTICLPTIHPPREDTPQDRTGGSERSGTHCTDMGKSAMASTVVGESGRSPNHSSRNTNTPLQPSGRAPPIGDPRLSTTGRLESVQSQVKDRGLSEEAFKIICSSWRHGTEKSYHLPGQSGFAGAVKGV